MTKLKVYRWTSRGTHETVAATTSFKAAAALAHQSIGSFRDWCSVSGNPEHIRIAMTKPGTVFVRPNDDRDPNAWRALK